MAVAACENAAAIDQLMAATMSAMAPERSMGAPPKLSELLTSTTLGNPNQKCQRQARGETLRSQENDF